MSFLTGKSKSKSQSQTQSQSTQSSESKNLAYPYLQQTYTPVVDQGIDANTMLSRLLGMGDTAAADAAYDRFKTSTGYETVFNDGQRAVAGVGSGRGVFNSGATAKALQARGQETAKSTFLPYLQMLLGLSGQGLQAGNIIGGSGGYSASKGQSTSTGTSTSSSSSKPGLAPLIGQAVSGIATGGIGVR